MFDLNPAAAQMQRLVSGVREEQLDRPTPCSDWTVGDLLAHINQFATVFAQNARKEQVRPPESLPDDWRQAIPARLGDLSRAWSQETAWQGRVAAGGIEMDAEDNAVVAIEELTVHGWDLARATGQDLRVDDTRLDLVDRFFELFGEEPFGPAAQAPDGTPRLERTVARTGRDPRWSPRAAQEIRIRPETPADVEAIRDLTTAAFDPVPYSDGSEPQIIDRLRADGDLAISLVAEDPSGRMIGHIAFSPVTAGNAARGWYGLGPVAVDPGRQGEGVGRALIEAGLAALKKFGASGCALVGDPGFYTRFGFSGGALSYQDMEPSLVQHLVLDDLAPDDADAPPAGELRFPKAFDVAAEGGS
ncbi:TIGR03086 family protein [Kocuria coralli]|uniref:TIGR03086 family protein n=1 Tax=Kocuria coralli TaxID=1461025 RepID=A0A5J5KVT7_9MICC|nr:TIGR03086 family metal-binding protein [Kocuria coralli]KAA9393694.1 TIGR03086 family protein [Kocuria coralli]